MPMAVHVWFPVAMAVALYFVQLFSPASNQSDRSIFWIVVSWAVTLCQWTLGYCSTLALVWRCGLCLMPQHFHRSSIATGFAGNCCCYSMFVFLEHRCPSYRQICLHRSKPIGDNSRSCFVDPQPHHRRPLKTSWMKVNVFLMHNERWTMNKRN